MRVTDVSLSQSVVRLRLEGRITQTTVAELVAAIEPAVAAGSPVALDLGGVGFVDQAGVDTLRGLRARGVVLAGCSSFLGEMLRLEPPVGRAETEAPGAGSRGDACLLDRLRRGDDAAFTELVEQYGGRLLAVAKRVLRNEDDARDAVQDAFLSACRALAAFKGDAKLSTWLHRIVINAALMRLRSRKQRSEQSIDDLLPRFDDEGWWDASLRPVAVSSHDLFERRESRTLVRGCIERLPDTYRTVLVMRDIEDLDTDEVAERLGVTPNAVKIRLHRARQALRSLIEQAQQQVEARPSAEPAGPRSPLATAGA